jgi:hypothetical protein
VQQNERRRPGRLRRPQDGNRDANGAPLWSLASLWNNQRAALEPHVTRPFIMRKRTLADLEAREGGLGRRCHRQRQREQHEAQKRQRSGGREKEIS